MDPLAISAGITGISNLGNIVKSLVGTLRESGKVEAIQQVIDLQMLVLDLNERNAKLAEEKKALEEQLKVKAAMKFDGRFYRQDGDARPFCALCWESTAKAIHLAGPNHSTNRNGERGEEFYYCANCNKRFAKSS